MGKRVKDLNLDSHTAKASTCNNKKQKWREIEQLKDKFKLEKELKMCEYSLAYMLDEF